MNVGLGLHVHGFRRAVMVFISDIINFRYHSCELLMIDDIPMLCTPYFVSRLTLRSIRTTAFLMPGLALKRWRGSIIAWPSNGMRNSVGGRREKRGYVRRVQCHPLGS